MYRFRLISPMLAAACIALCTSAHAEPEATTTRYAVMRDGQQIGTTTVQLRREGPHTTAQVKTQVQVKIAYITVYRYEQTETEQWRDGKLEAMNAVTDDNGTLHKVSARREGSALAVEADGK